MLELSLLSFRQALTRSWAVSKQCHSIRLARGRQHICSITITLALPTYRDVLAPTSLAGALSRSDLVSAPGPGALARLLPFDEISTDGCPCHAPNLLVQVRRITEMNGLTKYK